MKTLMISTVAVLFAGTAMADPMEWWDADNDGMISAEEYMAGENRDVVFEAWDTNNDGVLDAEEFAQNKFKMFDRDADNVWDEEDVQAFDEMATRTGADVSQ